MAIFQTMIGASAEGASYFPRPYLDKRLWNYIKNGNNILVSAPRRIGKTSFLLNISNQEMAGYWVKYEITQSVNDSNEFFKRLYKSLLQKLSTQRKVWESLTEIIKRNKIVKAGKDGIELTGVDIDYYDEFKRLVNEVEVDEKIVFIIDEFSETAENIINDQGEKAGQMFLHQNRELRQDKSIKQKIQFIYSGSIGLGNIAERIKATKSINDLTDFPMPPFSNEEVYALIKQITVSPALIFDQQVKEYLVGKVHWLLPYYIQIILDESENILLQAAGKQELTKQTIDKAIDEALKKRNYFEHWHIRLRTAFTGKFYTFAKEVLNAASKSKKGISKTQIFDLAETHNLKEDFNTIVRTLEYDGYITSNEKKVYIFNSPLLKIWWERNIAI